MIKLQTGDIIFVHGKSLSNKFLEWRYQSHFSHAALGYTDAITIEMTDLDLSSLPYIYYEKRAIQVIRFGALDEIDKHYLQQTINESIWKENPKFDKAGILLPFIKRRNHYTCLSYIDYLFKKALQWNIDTEGLMQGRMGSSAIFSPKLVYDYRVKY